MSTLLEFQSVQRAATSGGDITVHDLSFVLAPGELALFDVAAGQVPGTLADLASGMLDPDAGVVLFENQSWTERTAGQVAAARSRIGRVFAEPGWISNLDVDENVTLAARYHGVLEAGEAYRQAEVLAQRLGMPGLPAGRPAHVAVPDLRRAEWVRALLIPRRLVLLENPTRDMPAAWHKPLWSEVDRLRQEGAAVIWIEASGLAGLAERLKPTLQFSVETGNITRI